MGIADHIQANTLLPRLKDAECLVVYDPDLRYYDLCLALGNDQIHIIDTTAQNSVESREAAMKAFQALADRQITGLIVYTISKAPITPESKQKDPFAVYAECGTRFPDPNDDRDTFLNICIASKPEHQAEIRQIFATTPDPSFAVIDAIGSGLHHPQLRAILGAESAIDLIIGIILPTPDREIALKKSDGWLPDLKALLKQAIGLSLKTRSKDPAKIADEIWRFMLFSEFCFDLPITLPSALNDVPKAPQTSEVLINSLCDRLRNDQRFKSRYIEKAEEIEAELTLATTCAAIDDLGIRDTFPFEERTFLKRSIQGIISDDLDLTRELLNRHEHSIWRNRDENQEQWSLVQAALNLVCACNDSDRELPAHKRSLTSLVDFYISSLRIVDRYQREFEESVGTVHSEILAPVIDAARNAYRQTIGHVQVIFTEHIERESWPPTGKLSNAAVFDTLVAPRLGEKGRRVAYLMVDALRYELGVELARMLTEVGTVELVPAYAQLPTITLVGMASLLPGAQKDLTLEYEKGKLVPKLDGVTVSNVTQRMTVFRKRFGDRFAEMLLKDVVGSGKKSKIADTVELLVLRSSEIDSQLESDPDNTLSLIPRTLKLIRAALNKLSQLGFQDVVIATDHGFFLNAHAEDGDTCIKPTGEVQYAAHDRMILGNLAKGNSKDNHSVIISADKLGIRGSFAQAALPRTMAPYSAGYRYFHGGLSLTEAIVPVLKIQLTTAKVTSNSEFQVHLSYKKNNPKFITTRLPAFTLSLDAGLFTQSVSCEVLLEAQDAKGNVVGEPRLSTDLNPTTRTIALTHGESKQIVLKMDTDFEGKFTVKAMNPVTLTAYAKLELTTDYTV
jgi:hypothetical protein